MASYSWNGSANDGNYNNPANWTPNGVPGATDTVTIGTNAATTINAGNAAAGALTTNSHVTLNVTNNTSFTFGSGTGTSTFANGGTFALNSMNDSTSLIVGDSKLTLSGAGTIVLDNNSNNLIYGALATDTLSNGSNLIEGAGQLGNGQLTFVNGTSGVVNANQSNALVLNTGTIAVSNAGVLEATAGAVLDIASSVTDTTTGRITGAGGTVELQNGAIVRGGTLATSAGGAIAVGYSQSATLSGLANKGSVQVNDFGTLSLLGTIVNTGSIALQSTNDATYLIVAGSTVSLTGAGTVVLADNANNHLTGAAAADTLNNVNNTISGAGQLGGGTLTLINGAAGVIDATGSNALVLNTGGVFSNSGLVEATGGATLIVQNTTVNDGTSGRILAASGSIVNLETGTTVAGGTINSAGSGEVIVAYSNAATLDGSAHALSNLGTFAVQDYGTLSLLGSIVNTGTIALQSTNDATYLVAAGSTVSLTGTGTVLLSDNANNYITGATASDTLVNVNNTISGAGQLGYGTLTLVNAAAGVIDATGSNALVLNTGSVLANTGLIEATGLGGLIIQNTAINDSTGGTILAGTGSTVNLESGTTIVGGTVNSAGTGAVIVAYNNLATLDGSAHALTNLGTLAVQDYGTLSLLGTIINSAAITLGSTNDATQLLFGPGGPTPGTVTLTGGGSVTLSDNANNYLLGAITGDALVNFNNTISGAGQLGDGQLVLTNDATINATGTNALFLQTGNTVTNNALIEATGAGGLILQNDTVSNASGTVLAANSAVSLQNGATILGGLVEATGTGVVQVGYGETGTLSSAAGAIILEGQVQATDYGTLAVTGTIDNTGTISLLSTNDATELVIGSPTLTLTGGGSVALSDNSGNYIFGAAGTDTLDNVNNTISGAGHLGDGQLTLVNAAAGIIDATGSNALVLTTGRTITNNGLIEATGTGGLVVQGDTISNASGTLLAAGSTVSLQNSASIAGGLLKTTGGGLVQVTYNENGTLDGSSNAITLVGNAQATDYGSITVLGTIDNTGTISLLSTNDATELIVGSPTVTLNGGGNVVLSDNSSNYIYGLAAGDTLVNFNNTISGAGQLGAGQLVLVNDGGGIIDASGSNALVLTTGNDVTNNGLIEATGTGGLTVQADAISNSAGTVLAANSAISLQAGASIAGGLVMTTGTGVVQVTYGQNGTLDGSTSAITLAGNVQANDYSAITALGTIVNTGTISLLSTNDTTELIVGSPTLTLSGAGSLVLSNNSNNLIVGAAVADTLYNLNNTIEGSGNIGDGQLTLVNGGIIEATGSNALTISLGGQGTNTATGQLLGIGTGGLSIQNGTYSNLGVIQANDGSSVTFASSATLTNDSSTGTLTGGTYRAIAANNGATLAVTGAAVTTDAASILLSGIGSSITFGGTAIENSLRTIAYRAQLQILGGRSYSTALAVTNSGTLALGGGKLTTKGLTTRVGSLLSGFGTIAGTLVSNGSLTVTGYSLVLTGNDGITGAVSGAGTLTFSGGHTTIADTNPFTVANVGIINAATLAITQNLSFAGTFNINGASALGGTGTVLSSGLFEETGRGTVKIANAFTNTGTLSTVLLGTLAFAGGLANTGIILDNGGFTDTAALTGGSLYLGTEGTTAILASATGAGNSTVSTLSIIGGTLNANGTAITVTGDYVNGATGAGNTYNAGAHVNGTIDGQGTAMSVIGVEGTSIKNVNGTLTITLGAGGSAHFEIENTGAAGSTALRGALQTTVNGGSINGTALSGNGVTAANFGPILAGGHGGIYTITDKGGALTNEAIHLASDFANVAGLTIDIVAAPAAAVSSAGASLPDAHLGYVLPWLHHG